MILCFEQSFTVGEFCFRSVEKTFIILAVLSVGNRSKERDRKSELVLDRHNKFLNG